MQQTHLESSCSQRKLYCSKCFTQSHVTTSQLKIHTLFSTFLLSRCKNVSSLTLTCCKLIILSLCTDAHLIQKQDPNSLKETLELNKVLNKRWRCVSAAFRNQKITITSTQSEVNVRPRGRGRLQLSVFVLSNMVCVTGFVLFLFLSWILKKKN